MGHLKYAADHWSNDARPASALAKSAQLGTLPFNQMEWEMFSSLLPKSMEGLTVLDYGCGVGWVAIHCAQRGAKVVGIEPSEAAVRAAVQAADHEGVLHRCRFEVTDKVVGGPYDVILAKDVIEHLEDDESWVRDVGSALKPGGTFIFSTHNDRCLNYLLEGGYHRWWCGNTRWMGWDPTHVRFYNASTLTALLARQHLRVSKWASVWIIPYNIVHWLTLLRYDVTISSLAYFDRWFGKMPPFNRLGWGLMAVCRREQ